jgi:preprotein translocase subunit SecY
MLKAFFNIWKIKELRNKLLFTLGMLVIYRIGFFIPLPGVNQEALQKWAETQAQAGNAGGNVLQFMGIFTGGSLSQSTIFGLGIMPYISAAIIFQLLGTVLPSLQKLKDEGAAGQQKITEWTRYATVGLCVIQAIFWVGFMQAPGQRHVFAEWAGTASFWLCGVMGLTCGTVFLMWLGEQIDKHGIGNGISLIITAGILSRMDDAIMLIYDGFSFDVSSGESQYGPMTILLLTASFILVVAGSIVITQGQRRIPIQQAKHTRGRRVYGGQKSYLPLRVNHGGVMPIIFASALMMFPSLLISWMRGIWKDSAVITFLSDNLATGAFLYIFIYIAMIYFFAYFWTTVQFQPKEMAKNLRDHGSFIPGLRPGPRTAEYLETVMERITYVGAGFLAVIAVIPNIIAGLFGIPFQVSAFLGGTGLLITVSVMLDFVQRIEASLMMRNYDGFLGASGGKRIRGAQPT